LQAVISMMVLVVERKSG